MLIIHSGMGGEASTSGHLGGIMTGGQGAAISGHGFAGGSRIQQAGLHHPAAASTSMMAGADGTVSMRPPLGRGPTTWTSDTQPVPSLVGGGWNMPPASMLPATQPYSHPGGSMVAGADGIGGGGIPPVMPPVPDKPFWVSPEMLDSRQDSLLRPSLA